MSGPSVPLRCGVVGLGWWGRRVVEDLRDSRVIEVVAAADPAPAAREAVAGTVDRVTETFEDLLDVGELDAVVLTSPHRYHPAQLLAAARAGLHVFCEKPFASSLDEARRAVDALTARGLVVGVGHERRFEPPITDLRRALGEGRLGRPLHLEATFSHDKFLDLPPDNWRLSPQEAPVGPLSATGVHLMDLAIAMLGRPVQAWAVLDSSVPHLGNGAALAVQLAFDSGATAQFSAVLATPFAMRLTVYGTDGWTEIRDRTHPEAPTGWDVTRRHRGDTEPSSEFVPAYRAVRANLEAWATAALGGPRYPVSPEEILLNVAAFEAITRSALHGGLVALP